KRRPAQNPASPRSRARVAPAASRGRGSRPVTHKKGEQAGRLSLLHGDAARIVNGFQPDLDAAGRPEIREALSPLHQHDGIAVHEFIETQAADLALFVDAVEIDVVDAIAVFVNQ